MPSPQSKKQKLQERRHKKEVRRRLAICAAALLALAAVALIIGAYVCGYNYADMLCQIEHEGASAPANTALISAIPYAAAAVILSIVAATLFYKSKKKERSCVSDGN